ncbi:male abnormal protein mab-31-like isoform X2 [Oratosquilla oratoria]|uniref:male abnormal protein mab-31-like isoform X2 n=1 Tax=Oratosquilla oratoria TaxID=337810 RepID=UPI003F75D730
MDITLCTGCVPTPGDVDKRCYKDNKSSVQFLREHGVLPCRVNCPRCNRPCWFREDRHTWVCNNSIAQAKKKKKKQCTYSVSDYKGTFLERSHIQPWQLVCFINKWVLKNFSHEDAIRDLQFSTATSVHWRSFCSEVCEEWYNHQEPIGGPGIVVEIDETLISRRHANVGKNLSQVRMFGGIERESKKRVLVPLVDPEGEERDIETLVPIIRHFIRQGSVIVSGSRRAYTNLGDIGYTHDAANHSKKIVASGDREVHTENIKRLWRDVKEWVLRPGIRPRYFRQYLARYIFLKQCYGKEIHAFLQAVRTLYTPQAERVVEKPANVSHDDDDNEDEPDDI